jgi:cell wall-associated NlpC family hydrolase
MTPYFSTPERLAALRAHAEQWLGTPFAAHAMVRGAGVDCVHLGAALYMACGVFTEFSPPNYSLDAGAHQADSQVVGWLDSHPCFLRFPVPLPGDCLCFRFGKSEHHIGVLVDGAKFIHALPRRSVMFGSLRESYYAHRLAAIYRPMERGVI